MRSWLTRLLRPTRREARVFRTQSALPPTIDVLSETADVVTDALREGDRERARQRQQELETKGPTSPPPLPRAGKGLDAPPPTSLSVFPDPQVDPRLRALSRAGSPDERQRIAARIPELRPPHRCLTDHENLVLEWTYWDGLRDVEIKQKLGGAFLPHIVRNEALRKLAKHVAKRRPVRVPRQVPEPVYHAPHKHKGIATLQLASTAKQRQEAATKHPPLRPPHDALNTTQDLVLELAFWQGLTYKEVGKRLGLSSSRVSQISNLAIRKLSYRLARGGQLGVAPDLDNDRRLDDFRAARASSTRQEAAARYPELRPPHTFLLDRENNVLERFYWQGHAFDSIAEHHGLTRQQAGKVRDDAMKKLEVHRPNAQAQGRTPSPEAGEAVSPVEEVAPQAVVLGEDARITAFRRLGHPENRRKTAARHPELRPPYACLSETENDLLELVFWQGRTFAEVASLRGLPRKEIGTRVRRALEQFNRQLCRDAHQDEDRLDEVLLALNECGSVRRAAKKLEVGRDVLKAFLVRQGYQRPHRVRGRGTKVESYRQASDIEEKNRTSPCSLRMEGSRPSILKRDRR